MRKKWEGICDKIGDLDPAAAMSLVRARFQGLLKLTLP